MKKIDITLLCLLLAGLIAGIVLIAPAVNQVIKLRHSGPVITLLMANASKPSSHEWKPISKISPALAEAVIIAEDPRFRTHRGIDLRLIVNSAARNLRELKLVRGASTITMQVAKNLFLDPERTWSRKFSETALALIMESLLTKERILEIYLNIAEWGPRAFGAEAAARHHFNRDANELTTLDAAYLASLLPNPKFAGTPEYSFRFAVARMVIYERLKAMGF